MARHWTPVRTTLLLGGAVAFAGGAALVVWAAAGEGLRSVTALDGLPRPLVFAHRGGAGEAPEATLAALRAAARHPDVAVELDVHRSRDGHLVVIHDATVDRTTDGRGAVAALTLAELRALDAGHCATPGQGRGTARGRDCREGPPARFPFRGQGHRSTRSSCPPWARSAWSIW